MLDIYIKDTIKHSSKYFVIVLLIYIIGFVTVPVYTRFFSPEEYGKLSLINISVSIVVIIAEVGLPDAIIRFFPEYKTKKKEMFFTILILSFICSTIIAFFYSVEIFVLKNFLGASFYLFKLSVLIVIVNSIFSVLATFFRSEKNIREYGISVLSRAYLGFFLSIILITRFNFGLIGVLLGSFLVTLIIDILIVFFKLFSKNKIGIKFFSFLSAKKFILFGFPLIFNRLSNWILGASDRYFIAIFRGSADVGLYSVGYGLSQYSINLLIMSFSLATGPLIIEFWEKNGRNATENFLKVLTRYYCIIGVPIVVGITVLSKSIIEILTPVEYHNAYLFVPFVVIGIFIFGFYFAANTGLIIAKKTKKLSELWIIAAILNISLNIFFVPAYGAIGAAFTTMLSYLVGILLVTYHSSKYLTWSVSIRSFGEILISSLTMGIFISFLDSFLRTTILNVIFLILIGILIYLTALFLLKEIKKEEINEMKNLFLGKCF